jgi:hypothetical protein
MGLQDLLNQAVANSNANLAQQATTTLPAPNPAAGEFAQPTDVNVGLNETTYPKMPEAHTASEALAAEHPFEHAPERKLARAEEATETPPESNQLPEDKTPMFQGSNTEASPEAGGAGTAEHAHPFKDAATGETLTSAAQKIKENIVGAHHHNLAEMKHHYEQSQAEQAEQSKSVLKAQEKHDFNLFRGIGEFAKDVHTAAKGMGTGVAQTIDQARALGYMMHHEPGEKFDSLVNRIEEQQSPEELKSPLFQGGKFAGQVASQAELFAGAGAGLAAAGVPAAGAGTALATGGIMAENALGSLAYNAQEQLQHKGKVDPTEAAVAGGLGAGIGLAGAGVAQRVDKEFANRAAKAAAETTKKALKGTIEKGEELTKEALAATERGGRVFDEAIEKLEKTMHEDTALANEITRGIVREAQKIEHEGMQRLQQVMGSDPPTTRLELAQKAILDQIDAAYDTIEKGVEQVGKEAYDAAQNTLKELGVKSAQPAAGGAAQEAQGPFSRTLRDRIYRGFGGLKDTIPWGAHLIADGEKKGFLSKALFASADKALKAVGEKKAELMHAHIEEEAYIKHAFDLATKGGKLEELAAIEKNVEQELNSAGAAKAAEMKSEQTALQREHNIAQAEAHLARLHAQLDAANPGKKAYLLETIKEMDERLHRLRNPLIEFIEKHGNPREEYFYGMSDPARFALESARTRGTEWKHGMADNFHDALVQAQYMMGKAAKAQHEYDAAAKKALPLMKQVKEAWQEHIGNKIDTPAFGFPIKHPYNGTVSTDMMAQVRQNSTTEELFGTFKREHQKLVEHLMKQLPMVTEKIAHKVIQRLPAKEARERANQLLRRPEGLSPQAKHALRGLLFGGAAIGGSMLGTQAQAAEIGGKSEKEQNDYWTGIATPAVRTGVTIGGVVMLAVATKHFNLAGALKWLHTPGFLLNYFTSFTRDGINMADRSMGRLQGYAQETLPLAERSLTQALSDLRVMYAKANTFTQDNKDYFVRTLSDEIDGRDLSAGGKELLEEVKEAEKDVEKLVRVFGKDWNDHYKSLPPEQREKLKLADECVRFVRAAYSNVSTGSIADDWFAKGFRQSCRTLFTSSGRHIGGVIFSDAAAGSILQNGVVATMRAYRDVIFNPVVAEAVERMQLPGPRTAGTELKKIGTENFVKNISMAASTAKFFVEHQDEMERMGIGGYPELLDKLTTNKLPAEWTDKLFGRITNDLLSTGGHDFLNVEKSFLERSQKLSGLVNFGGAPIREAALWNNNLKSIFTDVADGQPGSAVQRAGWLLAASAVKGAYAGKAALPASSVAIGLSNPITAEATARLVNLLETYSIGTRMFGDMSDTTNGDMLFAPFLGIVGMPAFEELMNVMTNSQGFLKKTGKIGAAFESEHPEDMATGTRFDKDMQEAHDAIGEFLDGWSFIQPTLMGFPMQTISAGYKALPDIVNAESRFGTRRPGLQSGPFMLEGRVARRPVPMLDEKTGQPVETQDEADMRARYGAVLRALRLGTPIDQSRFMVIRQAEHAAAEAGDAEQLARLQKMETTTGWAGTPVKLQGHVTNE